jgi:hypothetical protein
MQAAQNPAAKGQESARSEDSALSAHSANHGKSAGLMCNAQKIAELGKDRVETFFRVAFRRHQDDFPAEFADGADFFIEVEKIGGDDFGFDAVGGRGTGPAHGINR